MIGGSRKKRYSTVYMRRTGNAHKSQYGEKGRDRKDGAHARRSAAGKVFCREAADGCDIIECESFALFRNAAVTGKKAAGLMQVVDLINRNLHATPEEREKAGLQMFEIALGTVLL